MDGEWKSVTESLKKLTATLEGTLPTSCTGTHSSTEKQEKLAARLRAAGIDVLLDAITQNEKAIAQLKRYCTPVPIARST